jgi:hypothetical protein
MAEPGRVSPRARLDHHEVEPERKVRRICCLKPAPGGLPQPGPLAPVDRLLREPEVTARSPAHLDNHEGARRPRVDRDQVKLRPADVDLPSQDRPAGVRQRPRNPGLGGVPGALLARAHGAGCPDRVTRDLSRAYLEQREIAQIEHRVVGHHRDGLSVQNLVRLG